MQNDRTLSREVIATQIPSGDKHPLTAGSKVFIHQVLGGSYTVQRQGCGESPLGAP